MVITMVKMLFLQDGCIYSTYLILIKVNKSQCGRGTDFKQDIVESIGNYCYSPTSGNCFLKCITCLIGKDYMKEVITFVRTEPMRSTVIATARIQPICRKHKIKIVRYDGFRIWPRNITDRSVALYIKKKHFCLFWKPEGVSFKTAVEELKKIFKVDYNFISDKDVKCLVKYEYKPKKSSISIN